MKKNIISFAVELLANQYYVSQYHKYIFTIVTILYNFIKETISQKSKLADCRTYMYFVINV